jgi:hypothetical protein
MMTHFADWDGVREAAAFGAGHAEVHFGDFDW